ncbi:DegT/DnrJ/EryC1/StrS family aminotransferase [Microbacterium tenebrionis]|uniref:DegT/DnrJ/EryC1/StrS family aminotransferase n=1 Tax=Microbacterium tenebrionis TaxID=2830665 RepID=UPI00158ADD2C|nr:DegT/DnrJ/EryC1/StrS family aminotransferase [Microbacterium ihumii]
MTIDRLAIDGGTAACGSWPSWPPPLDADQRALVDDVLGSGLWGAAPGGLCDRFSAEFAARHAAGHAVAVGNGTLALFVALRALGIGPGDEVIVPVYTFVACATAVLLAGATPVLADVSADHLHLTAETIQEAMSARTRAVMVVHLAGSPAPMAEILDVARTAGIAVIEDAAQAHGAAYRGRPVGAIGDVSTFSFQSSKAMTAGEGGLLVTDDAELAARAWSTANVGRTRGGEWYGHQSIGWNLRLTEIQAAILLPWIGRLDEEIARRNEFADALAGELSDAPIQVVAPPEGTTVDSRHLLMLRLAEGMSREWIARALDAEGLPVDLGYPGLHRIAPVAAESRRVPTPGLDAVADRIIWLRQPLLMSGGDGAHGAAVALRRVGADRRARGA